MPPSKIKMTEAQYIEKLWTFWPREEESEAPDEALSLADEAVRLYPNSTKLWIMRGNLIELGTGRTAHTLEDALACYEQAVKLDPTCVEAYEEIGYFLDNIMDEPTRAEPYFRKAEALRNS
jgi:tetratricopeptide (TPR) repeat protein